MQLCDPELSTQLSNAICPPGLLLARCTSVPFAYDAT
jgi:hypothetical protein